MSEYVRHPYDARGRTGTLRRAFTAPVLGLITIAAAAAVPVAIAAAGYAIGRSRP